MKRLGTVVLLLTMLGLAACGRKIPEGGLVIEDLSAASSTETDTVTQEDAEATEEVVEAEATEEIVVEADADATEEAVVEADADTTEETVAEEDTEAAEVEVVGDAERGAALFTNVPGNAPCSSCHYVDQDQMLVGPGMLGLGERAGERVSGQSAVEYLHNSILLPNDHVVEGFPAQVMPQNYGDSLTEDDINDLIAYLLSL